MQRRLVLWAALLLGLLLFLPLRAAVAHPLHTTITELTLDAGGRKVRAVIRIFANDFDAAVAGPRRGPTDAAARQAYLASRFVLRAADGRQIPLRWRGSRVTDDLLWIELEGDAPAGVRGGTVLSSVAADLFSDQVNIVKARYAGRERTLLFTRGAGPKKLN